MTEVYDDENPHQMIYVGDAVSFLYFTKDNRGNILDVERLTGIVQDIHYDLPEPYIVGWFNDFGAYKETYATLESTILIKRKSAPIPNGPKKSYITYNEEDFAP